ncbi:hypothetical protein BESB_014330 [Besnoitia besnoiti]|uniref:Uncharacterized protein n=1 Tax=Besnoitia besnoiti TaxID=94643 RepID=A0A2A9MBP7_BESBE|nr:hypothetical protein BESB_014330 [Besnoitia besnoiti]PFH32820.1 hypothetical protein BESB_014330 [Besnoitia besnoiti]
MLRHPSRAALDAVSLLSESHSRSAPPFGSSLSLRLSFSSSLPAVARALRFFPVSPFLLPSCLSPSARSVGSLSSPVLCLSPPACSSSSPPCLLLASFSSSASSRRAAPRAASRSRSLFAEELAACDTSAQVLQLLRTPAFSASSSSPSGSRSPYACPSAVLLLPDDCLAFLNALLRVQHVKRSGADFVFFCDVLENAMRRFNASAERERRASAETGRAAQALERNLLDCIRGKTRKAESLTERGAGNAAGAAERSESEGTRREGDESEQRQIKPSSSASCCRSSPISRRRSHSSKWYQTPRAERARRQKKAEKGTSGESEIRERERAPYLEPHLPYLSAFDAAECVWALATLQPPEWRVKNGALLRRLLDRLLATKSGAPRIELAEETTQEDDLDWVRGWSRGKRPEDRHARAAGGDKGDTEDGDLLLDSLSSLMIYRVVFGLAKLDFRCVLSQQVLQALAPKIRRTLEEEGSAAFPTRYLVRLTWSYARLRVRDGPLFVAFAHFLAEAVDGLSYEELKVVKHVFEALEFWDRRLLGAVDELLHQLQELGPDETYRQPRSRPFNNRPRRVGSTFYSRARI